MERDTTEEVDTNKNGNQDQSASDNLKADLNDILVEVEDGENVVDEDTGKTIAD